MTKTETIQALRDARRRIIELANTVPVEKRDEVFLGVWSTQDMLSHLVGWDYATIESAKEMRAGIKPSYFEHYDKEWAAFNALLVSKYKRNDWGEMLDALEVSHHAVTEFLEGVPDEDFDRDFGLSLSSGGTVTIRSDMEAEIKDDLEHYQQLKEWLDKEAQ